MNSFLTASQVSLLKKSFRQFDAQAYSDYFYTTLFTRHPEVRKLFPIDMRDLKVKLMSVFELVIFSFEEKQNGQFVLQNELIIPLRHLGKAHEEKGVQPAHYSIANGLMLETLEHVLGNSHTQEIKQAWQAALSQLTAAMLNTSIKLNDSVRKETGSVLRDAFGTIIQKIKGYSH